MDAAANTFSHDLTSSTVCFLIRFDVMEHTLALAGIVLLAAFVGLGIVLTLGLLSLLAEWPDDDYPLD